MTIDDLFNDNKLDLNNITCHSGGATGSDTYFENMSEEFGVRTRAYSYKTKSHISQNKVEISDSDYQEGVIEVNKANKTLGRFGISKYMNLLARNWSQVKYSKQIFAIGHIIKPGDRSTKGYKNTSKYETVDGGTGYAVQMGINNEKQVYVFDQGLSKWFRWSYTSLRFIEMKETPKITEQNFAGIGTREIKTNGIKAIEDLYEKTFN